MPTGRPSSVGRGLRGEEARGGPVVEAGRVAGGDVAVRPERGLQRAQLLQRRAGAGRFVDRREAPAPLDVPGRHRHEVGLDLAGRVGCGEPVLAGHGIRVAPVLGDVREAVVEVLRGLPHDEGRLVDDALGDDPRVGVDALTHRVAPHVLDAAGDRDVDGAEPDGGRDVRHRRHGSGTHPVDGVAGGRGREAGQQARQAPEGQALVADLGGGSDGHLLHPLLGQLGVAPEELADALDDEVVGARLGVHALLAGASERGADAVDEDDVLECAWHGCLPGLGGEGPGRPRALGSTVLSGRLVP